MMTSRELAAQYGGSLAKVAGLEAKINLLIDAERERVNAAWIATLHEEDVVDMKDADESNKRYLLGEVKKRLVR
jgi:hypothetical protein